MKYPECKLLSGETFIEYLEAVLEISLSFSKSVGILSFGSK